MNSTSSARGAQPLDAGLRRSAIPPLTMSNVATTVPAALILTLSVSLQSHALPPAQEPILGGPCEGCEAIFDGLPDSLSTQTRIAPIDEPGEALRIEGTVRDGAGHAIEGIIVYAYHTDAHGIYPHNPNASMGNRHGRLRGWAKTDAQGRYGFDTIRPSSYPDSRVPAHVHMHVLEPGRGSYWIDDIHFRDDRFLSPQELARLRRGRGGSGLAMPEGDARQGWSVRRDIVLGLDIPGYPTRQP